MLVEEKKKLQTVVELINKLEINSNLNIEYFIPGVLVTADGSDKDGGPYIQFTYTLDTNDSHTQHMPLKRSYLEKTPQDLANFITFSLEQFIEEIDSRQYGAQ